ncbi:hypothetical protein GCM10010435_87360 [Winogradskya consettensis]|uniref:Uncharacterized protein n=1 Tax=Winogradskya consettensis TaxID=113560 RepID=A0A919VYX6_9ACTN|nr:hypothetical protein [Actinoplanes consettensis]GIM80847.1 hypothetical protein Aco04nite_73070 [Actinoplanes consettensis]
MTENQLHERLEAVPVPPSRVDVAGLLRAGRRRTRRRRALQAAGSIALVTGVLVGVPLLTPKPAPKAAPVAVVPSPAPSPVTTGKASCVMTKLAVPKGIKDVIAEAVDPTGKYIAGNGTIGQDFRGVLWTGGRAEALPVDGDSVQASAVNEHGVVVGLLTENNRDSVFRYENHKLTKLRTPSGSWTIYPEPAINATGDIVINLEPLGNSGGKDSFAVIWKDGATTADRLPLPEGANVHAILDDGTLIGSIYRDGSAVAGYAWDKQGKGTKLKVPDGQSAAAYAGRGEWVTGGLWPAQEVALWNLRTGELTRPGKEGPADTVNGEGWVVAGGSVWHGEDEVRLAAPAGQGGNAMAVSDSSLVVGSAVSLTGDKEPVGPRSWQC